MNLKPHTYWLLAGLTIAAACKKDEYQGKDPYADAKQQIGIKLNTTQPSPASGAVGTEVKFSGKGFLAYKDSIKLRFNGQPAEMLAISDSTIRVKVPALASSGIVTLHIGKDVFPGPAFTVAGAVSVDKSFQSFVGANNAINDIAPLADGRFLLSGSFTDFNNAGVRSGYSGMVMINGDGTVDKSFKIAPGFNGTVAKAAQLKNGQLLAAGIFSKFGTMKFSLGNIALIKPSGEIHGVPMEYTNQNGDPAKDTVPAFNAYFDGPVTGLIEQEDGRIIVMGNYRFYMSKNYYPAGKDTVITDSIPAGGMVRIYPDGKLDKTFRYNATTNSIPEGVNGYVADAALQSDGKLVIGGMFSQYGGQPVKPLFRINANGTVDETFEAGGNLNGDISSVRLLSNDQLLVTGTFSQIGGKERRKIAVLEANGTATAGFDPGAGADGAIMMAERLGNGKILATGTFQQFTGVNRYGLAILEANGKLSATHNNIGGFGFKDPFFSRPAADIITLDQFTTILVGNFFKVDLQQNNRIVRLSY